MGSYVNLMAVIFFEAFRTVIRSDLLVFVGSELRGKRGHGGRARSVSNEGCDHTGGPRADAGGLYTSPTGKRALSRGPAGGASILGPGVR